MIQILLEEHEHFFLLLEAMLEINLSENYVYFTLNGENIIARVEATSTAKVLQKQKVAFDMSLARYFDKETQQVIHRPGYTPQY